MKREEWPPASSSTTLKNSQNKVTGIQAVSERGKHIEKGKTKSSNGKKIKSARSEKTGGSLDQQRYAEFYSMQEIFDDLYQKSLHNEELTDLLSICLSENNIKLAYRKLKNSSSLSKAERKKLREIGKLTVEEVVQKIRERVMSQYGYHPVANKKEVHWKEGEKKRPIATFSIWDKLIQQCIKQVLDPVCEARFSDKNYGFRPDRSQENAIAVMYRNLQQLNMFYVVELDIKDFFENINHAKLKRALWAMNIHDKELLYVIDQIIKTPIQSRNGKPEKREKGIIQGGVLSPLLSNIYLNEFDQWLDAHWEEHPMVKKYAEWDKNGLIHRGSAYKKMRKLGYGATCFSISFLMVNTRK